jgi:hypothetical protein
MGEGDLSGDLWWTLKEELQHYRTSFVLKRGLTVRLSELSFVKVLTSEFVCVCRPTCMSTAITTKGVILI